LNPLPSRTPQLRRPARFQEQQRLHKPKGFGSVARAAGRCRREDFEDQEETFMRKVVALSAGVVVLAVALVAPSVAQTPAPELTIDAKVIPNVAGTKERPQGVKLNVKAKWKQPTDFEKSVIQKAKVLFPKGSLYRGGKYPKCSKSLLDRGNLAGCPKKSIMGKGVGVAFADTTITRPKVTVVNGGQKKVYLFTEMTNPARVRLPVDGTIKKRSGKWAYELTLDVPRRLQIVAGIPIALTSFNVTAGGKSYAKDWIATTSCPKSKKWTAEITTYYDTGGSDTFTDSVACKSRKR
jgi:hypothetical protein